MRLMIVARDAPVAESIRRALRYAPTCRVIGWMDGRNSCAGAGLDEPPDVIVIDESVGSAAVLAWARDARASMPNAKIVLLTQELDASLLADAEAAGVDAAISKTASPASVGMLVREVVAGHVFRFAPAAPAPASTGFDPGVLTVRELEILRLVAAGLSNGRIAGQLWVTEQTVKFHLSNVYRKLGAREPHRGGALRPRAGADRARRSAPGCRRRMSAAVRPAEPAIPLARFDHSDPELLAELLATVEAVAGKAAFIGGPEVDAFEREWADYCGSNHAVGLSSGTEALALALRALGVGPGDEVIVPANSFIATAEAVTLVGAVPRFVDVDPETALVTAASIEPAIGPRTRAVIPVHLYGRTVDLEPILGLARAAGVALIEDACQAHGAWIGGQPRGRDRRLRLLLVLPGEEPRGLG